MNKKERQQWSEVKWTQENKSLVWETRDCTLKQYNRKKKSCIIFGNEKVWGKGFLWCPWLLWLMMKGMREVVFSKFGWRRRRITDFLFYMHMWDRDQSVQVCVCREDYDERMMIGKREEKQDSWHSASFDSRLCLHSFWCHWSWDNDDDFSSSFARRVYEVVWMKEVS